MSFDSKCWELAGFFLVDSGLRGKELESNTDELAQRIQDTIEDFTAELLREGARIPKAEGL